MNLLNSMRFIILLLLTSLYGWFCWQQSKFIEIPLDVWAVGLVCAGSDAVDLFVRIKDGLSGNNKE